MPVPNTVSVMDLPKLMPEQYGAGGKGLTDDSAALKECILSALSLGITKIEVSGKYRIDSLIEIPMAPNDYLHFEGGGQFSQTFQSNNADGCLKFGDGTTKQWNVTFSNCGWEPLIRNAGTPLQVLRGNAGLDLDSTLVMTSCYLGAVNDTDTDVGFSNGIVATNNYRPQFWNVRIGSRDTGGTKWDSIFDVDGSFKSEFWGVYANVATGPGALKGISSIGTNQEGLNIVESTFNGQDIGLYYVRDTAEPGFRIHLGHFNSESVNMYLDGVKCGLIHGTLFYTNNAPGDTTDIHCKNVDSLSIVDVIHRTGGGLKKHLHLDPRVGGFCRNIMYSTNGFYANTGGEVPIHVEAGCSAINLHIPFRVGTTSGISYPDKLVEVDASLSKEQIQITSAKGPLSFFDDATSGPTWALKRLSDTPAASDILGRLVYEGYNANLEEKSYFLQRGKITDTTASAEFGAGEALIMRNGSEVVAHEMSWPGANLSTAHKFAVREAGDVYSLQRVKVGANGTGPGGTGRALYIDDA